jgi:hypothetical protein
MPCDSSCYDQKTETPILAKIGLLYSPKPVPLNLWTEPDPKQLAQLESTVDCEKTKN